MVPRCSSFLFFLLRQSSHRSGGGTWLWQELRWRKCWRGQLLRKRLIGWLPHLGTPPWNLSSLHLLPPPPPLSLPHRTQWTGGGKLSPATSTWSLSATHLLPPLMPPIFLCSNSCLLVCLRTLTQPWLMGISHFWYMPVRAHGCEVNSCFFFLFQTLFSVGAIKKALYLSIYFAWLVSTWWHWFDIFDISPLEDKILAIKCSVKCTKPYGYYSSELTPKQSHDGSCMTGYHDYWRHFSIHLCCSNCSHLALI